MRMTYVFVNALMQVLVLFNVVNTINMQPLFSIPSVAHAKPFDVDSTLKQRDIGIDDVLVRKILHSKRRRLGYEYKEISGSSCAGASGGWEIPLINLFGNNCFVRGFYVLWPNKQKGSVAKQISALYTNCPLFFDAL